MNHPISSEHIKTENRRYFSFINLALILAVITGIEIVIIFIPVSKLIILTSLIVLSAVKFIGVILWFMHLIYDQFLLTLFFLIGLMMAVGITIALLFILGPEDIAEPVQVSVFSDLNFRTHG